LDTHFIEEAFIGRGPQAQMATVVTFRGLTKDVSRGVPENAFPCTLTVRTSFVKYSPLAFWMFKVE
jgi:hypothetical protein